MPDHGSSPPKRQRSSGPSTYLRDFEKHLGQLIGPQLPTALGMELGPEIVRLLDPQAPLPPWREVAQILQRLGLPGRAIAQLASLHSEALRRRVRLIPPAEERPDRPTAHTPNGSTRQGGHPAAEPRFRSQTPPPLALEDVDGHNYKPDPLSADPPPHTFAELDDLLLSYWEWAGRPSSRQLALRSGKFFSHATVAKLTGNRTNGKPFSKRLEYVQAFIWACGGAESDQRNWVTAWRQVNHRERGESRSE